MVERFRKLRTVATKKAELVGSTEWKVSASSCRQNTYHIQHLGKSPVQPAAEVRI